MPLKYKHTILLVDDEESITKALQRLFRKEGYKIFTATSGHEGIELLNNMEKSISLIISDQRMPRMTGSQFLEKVKEIFPDAIRFLLTGYSDMDAIVDAINSGEIHRYLTKPWNDNDLLLQVRQSLEQFELKIENRRLLALTRKQNKELKELNKNLEQKVEERSREIIVKNKELESNLYNTVRAFASLAETHAPMLAGHGRRVSRLSREIAQFLNLPENEITHIEIAALLHDIGKLGLPEKLMNYSEKKWTPEEEALFIKHPEDAQAIVRFISSLDHIGLLIRSHHERYDGQGYPDQLSDESIPLGSKIIAVADAYDKIVNLKVNEKSCIGEYLKDKDITQDHLPEDELLQQAAIHHLRQYGFTRYDPDIIKVVLSLLKEKGIRYKEKLFAIEGLKAGMVLSRSLYTYKRRFLLPCDTLLTEDIIGKLKIIHKNDQLADAIYVIEK